MRDPRARALTVSAMVACATGAVMGTVASGVAFASAGLLTLGVFASLARHAWRHERLSRHLIACSRPGRVGHRAVRLLRGDGAAFVAGLRAPSIYCDERLLDELSPDELEAVTLHERAHQLARDPLRLVALAAVAPLARRLPGGHAWLERAAARREIAADRFALARGATRRSLAASLLKTVPLAAQTAPGFAPVTDLRLRALLGESAELEQPRWGLAALGMAIGTSMCLVLWHPSVALGSSALGLCCR